MKEFDAKYEDYEAIYGERENEDESEVEDLFEAEKGGAI